MSRKLFDTPPKDREPLFSDVAVVGTQFRPEASKALFDVLDDVERSVTRIRIVLRHEGDNPHDASAQAVDVLATQPSTDIRFHIGYVPRKLARAVHLKQSEGVRITAYLRDLDYEPHADVPYRATLDIYEEG